MNTVVSHFWAYIEKGKTEFCAIRIEKASKREKSMGKKTKHEKVRIGEKWEECVFLLKKKIVCDENFLLLPSPGLK